jgi:glycolate oxidase FAD binding subunit
MVTVADRDISSALAEAVKMAARNRTPLAIVGNGTKRFYTGEAEGKKLDVTGHVGIVSYEPTELVITARAGTKLADVEAVLSEKGQMLGFEPPHFGDAATLGGTIACGFSGPRRPYAGSARDFVLGAKIINGKGEILKFGGEVMKNVAGYDISRLMVGARGTLGVLLEISLKVLPKPAKELTLAYETPADKAIKTMNNNAGQPLPLSAACHIRNTLYVRLSGNDLGVQAARTKLGGDLVKNGDEFWKQLREHWHDFFQGADALWRLSVPPATSALDLPGNWIIDWGGAQRWLKSAATPGDVYRVAEQAGGHATLFRPGTGNGAKFHPLPAALVALQHQLKQAFDPGSIMNQGLAETI